MFSDPTEREAGVDQSPLIEKMIKRLLVGQDPEIVNIENDLAVEIEGAQGLEIGKGLDQETVREVDLEIVKKGEICKVFIVHSRSIINVCKTIFLFLFIC